MLLGKRPRGTMKRTASMTGIKADLGDVEPLKPSDSPQDFMMNDQQTLGGPQEEEWKRNVVVGGPSGFDGRQMATVSPRYHKRSSGGSGGGGGDKFIETAPFLRRCGLCNHRLRPSRDIFMYRGDTAFCSLECREQQMEHDERKEECSITANLKKDENHHHYHPTPPATTTTTTAATTAAFSAAFSAALSEA